MPKPLIIENVICWGCGHQFFVQKSLDEKYICPNCKNEVDYHKDECSYVRDK